MMDQRTSGPSPRPELRASDADRERTAQALRRHHLDGRLDTDELQDRLGRCYAARTLGELAPLVADLPEDDPAPARPVHGRAPRARRAPTVPEAGHGRPRGGAPLVPVLLLALVVAGTLAAIAHEGHPGPLPFLAVVLLIRLARGPGRRWSAGGTRV